MKKLFIESIVAIFLTPVFMAGVVYVAFTLPPMIAKAMGF